MKSHVLLAKISATLTGSSNRSTRIYTEKICFRVEIFQKLFQFNYLYKALKPFRNWYTGFFNLRSGEFIFLKFLKVYHVISYHIIFKTLKPLKNLYTSLFNLRSKGCFFLKFHFIFKCEVS